MAENKTTENNASVQTFLNKLSDEKRKSDSYMLLDLFEKTSGYPPKMWGDSIIGFGSYHYKYDSGREGDFLLVGFAPRKNAISLYFSCDIENQLKELISKLGKVTHGKSCVYVKNVSQIDTDILKKMIKKSIDSTKKLHP